MTDLRVIRVLCPSYLITKSESEQTLKLKWAHPPPRETRYSSLVKKEIWSCRTIADDLHCERHHHMEAIKSMKAETVKPPTVPKSNAVKADMWCHKVSETAKKGGFGPTLELGSPDTINRAHTSISSIQRIKRTIAHWLHITPEVPQ